MEKPQVLFALKSARAESKKRNFEQSIDLIINLKNLDLKKPEGNINTFLVLKNRGKKAKIGAFAGPELINKAKELCKVVISIDEFPKYSEKNKIKKAARQVDFFIAQAELMPKIAISFGKILGPMGKMPNPKAGCVVPKSVPTLKPVFDKLTNTIKLQTKSELIIKCIAGSEKMSDEEIADNILLIYDFLMHTLPQEKNNFKNMYVKLSMGKPAIIMEESGTEEKSNKKQTKNKKTNKK